MNDYHFLRTKAITYYSQHGEDGVLEYLLTKIPTNKWAVEFGAWDAKYLSNTFYFIEKKNYQAVLIEGDATRIEDAKKNTAQFNGRVIPICAFIEPDGANSLDNLLKPTPLPYDFDILSIDIDGKDYHIWDSFKNYKPKIVIIEINAKQKPDIDKIHRKDDDDITSWVAGSSIRPLTTLAHQKGYALVANIGCNAIYVDAQYLKLFYDTEPTPAQVFNYQLFDLSELSLAEAKQKSWKDYIGKLIRLPYHLVKYRN